MQKLSILFSFLAFLITSNFVFGQKNANSNLSEQTVLVAHLTVEKTVDASYILTHIKRNQTIREDKIRNQEKYLSSKWVHHKVVVSDSGRKKYGIIITNNKLVSDLFTKTNS